MFMHLSSMLYYINPSKIPATMISHRQLRNCGSALQFVSWDLQNDASVVLAAVEQVFMHIGRAPT